MPLFSNLLAQTGAIWGLFTLSTQAPTYFNFVLKLNIKQVIYGDYNVGYIIIDYSC